MFEREEPTSTEKIINAVGLQFEEEIEIVEFHNMIESEAQEENLEEESDPVELNLLEFFLKALSYFEEETNGPQQEAKPNNSTSTAIKTALLADYKQFGSSRLLNDPISTRKESLHSLLGQKEVGRSISNLNFCAMEVNNIVGTNSKLSSEYQMSDTNLRLLKEVIRLKDPNYSKPKVTRKGLNAILKKLLRYLPGLRIMKDLIYFVDEDKFGNERYRYVMPKNEINRTIQELHCKETAGHLGTDKTIEKIKSRLFWTNLSRDVKKFVKECIDCQKFKPPKTYCKPKLMPLGPTRTLMIVTMDMAGTLPETPRGDKHILAMCDHLTKHVKIFPMKGKTAQEVAEKCMDNCMTFGIPDAVRTDKGTNFTSQVVESMWELLDVHTLRTTAYHPKQTASPKDSTVKSKKSSSNLSNKRYKTIGT